MPPLRSSVSWCSTLLSDCGPLVHETEQEFAKRLMTAVHGVSGRCVRVFRLAFKDIDLATVEVQGVWPGWPEMVVRLAPTAEGPGPAARGPQPRPAIGNESEDTDLLEQVLQGPTHGRPRGRGRGRGGQTSCQLRQALVSSLPFDPATQADQDELVALMREEHVLLPEAGSAEEPAERALECPVMAASLDRGFQESVLTVIDTCQQANGCVEAAFAESDDDEVVGEAADDAAPDDPVINAGDGEGSQVEEVPDENPSSAHSVLGR